LRRPILTTRFAWIIAGLVGLFAFAHLGHDSAHAQTIATSAESDAMREVARDAADAAREQAETLRAQARDDGDAIREAARAEREAVREEGRALRDARHSEHIHITIPSTIDIDMNS